jgi:predicted unusual protein kinase regulating ubiquinone biosynthesis (AarF/ABC1/UbiB family)
MSTTSRLALRAIVQRRPLTSMTLSGLTATVAYATWLENETERLERNCILQHATTNTPSLSSSSSIVPTLPRLYHRDAIRDYWNARPVTVACRVGEIFTELTPLLWMYIRDFHVVPMLFHNNFINNITNSGNYDSNNKNSMERAAQEEKEKENRLCQQQHATRLRLALTRLGPAFVKMGQQLSIRPDLVPSVVLQELQKLCDDVEAVPDSVALQVLQDELGFNSLDELHKTFRNIRRVASASLGQVYQATLEDETTGEQKTVAIKVQRPDMPRKLSVDLYLLQLYGNFMDAITSRLTHQIPYHANFMNNLAHGSYMELDYEKEAANQVYFQEQLAARKVNVKIPAVYPQYTSRRVLTSEWIDGVKLVDAPADTIAQLIPVGVELFLTQLLDIGAFHADPHPANLYVIENKDKNNNKEPQLCLLDFGLVAEIDAASSTAMIAALYNLLSGNFDALIAHDAKQLGFLPHDLDVTDLQPILTKILTQGLLESGSNMLARKRKLLDISHELNEVFFTHAFSVPPFFALITRGLALLEGIALSGNADFDIFQASYPYARKRAMEQMFGSSSSKARTGSSLLFRNASLQQPSQTMATMATSRSSRSTTV